MGAYKWTIDAMKADALKYTSRGEWSKKSCSAYNSARKRGYDFLNECCAHMVRKKKWSDEKIKADALKYSSRSEWRRESNGAYCSALKQGYLFLDECCEHMVRPDTRWKWTDEKIKEDASKYKLASEWRKNSKGIYEKAWRLGNDFFAECCAHMHDFP